MAFALVLAKDILEVFSEVPYVKILATTVQHVISISEQITAHKERCAELVEKVSQYSRVVFDALIELKKRPELERLRDDLEQISSVIDGIRKLLATVIASNKSIVRRVLGREEVSQKLGEYDRKLDTSITLFQLKTSIVLRVNAQNIVVPDVTTPVHPTRYTRQYSKPYILIGRDEQISQLVKIFTPNYRHYTARVCIQGPGGVGKTSLALGVFHEDRIVQHYGDNRYFVSCEAATSPDLLVAEIAYALDINTAEDHHLLDTIQRRLRLSASLLVLDNFETSWDPLETRSRTEDILSCIASHTSIIVTLRGSQKPSKCQFYYDQGLVLPPLDHETAKSLFYTISNKQDEHASRLVEAVDGLPLAVTLLANLAAVEGETTASLWARWQQENTSMVENGCGRLNSLDASIKMSLSSQSMGSDPGALPLLSLLCMLPDGMSPDFLRACETDFPEPFLVRKAVSTLRRNALIQEDSEHYLKVLNPIRLYTQSHHPVSPKIRSFLHTYFLKIAHRMSDPLPSDASKLRQEAGNVNAILCDTIQHTSESSFEGVIDAIFSFCQYSYISGGGSVQPLLLAEKRLMVLEKARPKLEGAPSLKIQMKGVSNWTKARQVFSAFGLKASANRSHVPPPPTSDTLFQAFQTPLLAVRADLLGCMGQLYSRQLDFAKAIEALKAAQHLHIQVGDRAGQAYDLLNIGLAMHQRKTHNHEQEESKDHMFQQALQIHTELGDLAGQAHGLLAIGYAYYNSDELKQASDTFHKASDIFSSLADDAGLAATSYALGLVDQAKSAFGEAEKQFRGAVALYQRIGDQVGEAQALTGIAITWLLRSRFSEAFNFLTEAMKLREPSVNPDHVHLLGRIYIAQEQWSEARQALEKSLRLHEVAGDLNGQLADHAYLATIELHTPPPRTSYNRHLSIEQDQNPHVLALNTNRFHLKDPHTWDPVMLQCEVYLRYAQLRRARRLAKRLTGVRALLTVAHTRHLMGVVQLRMGRLDDALTEFDTALALHTQCDNLQGKADDINGICEALMRKGEFYKASLQIQDALALHGKVGHITGQGNDMYVQGCIYLAQGALQDAEASIRSALVLHGTSGYIFGQGRDLATLSDILWQKKQSSADSILINDTDLAQDSQILTSATDNEADADQALEQAMKLFTQCRARGEYRQCLKLQTERSGKPWVERVFKRHRTNHDDDEVALEWQTTYETDGYFSDESDY
ncbi:hypothetical protein BJ165DRAFT_1334489 [Panaeolus papilionaceus]|nr:hypothetical protein BJ165DRAFT_1334489 [Panaeolus papilionaceus]